MTGPSSRFHFPSLRAVAVASAFCCAGLASAQGTGSPSVTLYGIADIGYTQVSGLKAGTVSQIASGIMEGSRWGLKGSEDLGGGYKAIFTLESRVELDTGSNSNTPISGSQVSDRFAYANASTNPSASTNNLGLPTDAQYRAAVAASMGIPAIPTAMFPNGTMQATVKKVTDVLASQGFGVNVGTYGNRTFDRQAYAGLVTPFGAVLAGRMYTPAFETNATYDIMETQSGLSAGQVVAFPAVLEIRKSNSLAYRFVKDGISGALMYSYGDTGENANDSSRMIGLNANYKMGGFSAGFGHNTANNEYGQKSLTTSVLGASMDYGSDKVSGMVITMKDDNPTGFSGIAPVVKANGGTDSFANLIQTAFVNAFKQNGILYHLGYRHTTGPHAVSVAFTSYNDKTAANADVKSYGAAYTYSLSKRTDLSAVLVRFDNNANAQLAPGGNGYIGGVTASAGTDSTGLAFGIRHRF